MKGRKKTERRERQQRLPKWKLLLVVGVLFLVFLLLLQEYLPQNEFYTKADVTTSATQQQ